ncbi:hypothetical protein [Ramlibacter rhizophilus]|uniref:Lipoprotein n=1 Tax=Ramlibacter rhizophilus TaxID=1781167 RepID=A0A4Z0BQY6_9BURK|nr:hypothetical protein [Ramlibacter rhizophilus]TFZ01182.1 hypothetical protein EZ242_07285 [Ramlibacter rhizophilus]
MRSESTKRIAAVLGLALGAAVMSGCANWRDEGRMGAGPMMKEDPTKAPPRGAYGPGTVMPSGTQGPSGTGAGAGTGTGTR